MHDTATQVFDWRHQRLVAQDYSQYINGWTDGYAVTHAIQVIKRVSVTGPIVVITGDEWGLPADAPFGSIFRISPTCTFIM